MPDGWFMFGEGGGRLFDLSRAPMGVLCFWMAESISSVLSIHER